MATPAQIAANQANALKSTGPKSEEGKQSAKMNAVTHGIFTTLPIADMEDSEAFNQLSSDVMNLYEPSDIIEEALAERIVMALWRLQRARIAEAAQLNAAMTPEIITKETNLAMNLSFPRMITQDQIFKDQSTRYQYLLKMEKELENIDFHRISAYPSTIEAKAPTVYSKFPEFAEQYNLSWEQFIEVPTRVEKALNEAQTAIKSELSLIQTHQNAKKTADLIKKTKLIPNEKYANLIMTYEARADNAFAKAADAFKKHRESRLKLVESEPMNQ